jgi:putative transposase
VRAAEDLAQHVGVVAATDSLGVSRATLYRRRRPSPEHRPRVARRSPRALAPAERSLALEVLHEERFVDRAPAAVVACLLDEGRYVASERTLYRLLTENHEVRERRNQRRHPLRPVPRLCARAPREVWTWDITPLPGPVRGIFFQLFVMLDLFSRYVVAWMVAARQTADLAAHFVKEAVAREGVQPGTLVAHSDRGAPMTSRSLALLYADLGVLPSHSRPRVSNDNPFSESQFKTAKYHPTYPDVFLDEEDARRHFEKFFLWYNHDHRHGGLACFTPADVHLGRVEEALRVRQAALDAAFAAHPERFPRGRPVHARPPAEVWINPPIAVTSSESSDRTCPGSTDPRRTPPGASHEVTFHEHRPTRAALDSPTPDRASETEVASTPKLSNRLSQTH